jgi:hypothetical protein
MPEWLPTLIASVMGAGLASYVGVKVALTELRVQMADVRDWIKELRKRSHDHHNDILRLQGQMMALEDRMDRLEE